MVAGVTVATDWKMKVISPFDDQLMKKDTLWLWRKTGIDFCMVGKEINT
jgi:hypothetical protein